MDDGRVIKDFKNGAGTGVVHFQLNEAKAWHLMIGDDPAYLAGYAICDSCEYVFTKVMPGQKLAGAVPSGTHELISDSLSDVTAMPNRQILEAIGMILPSGNYSVVLAGIRPRLVLPGGPGDYFTEEAVATWGLDPYFGVGHSPHTPYYRLAERDLGPVSYGGKRLGVALAVPLFPPTLTGGPVVESYRAVFRLGSKAPTALAIGLVDDRGPANLYDPEPIYWRHLIVSLYVLDGHHKLLAAAEERTTIQVLAFFPRSIEGLAVPDEVDRGIELLAANERLRSPTSTCGGGPT